MVYFPNLSVLAILPVMIQMGWPEPITDQHIYHAVLARMGWSPW